MMPVVKRAAISRNLLSGDRILRSWPDGQQDFQHKIWPSKEGRKEESLNLTHHVLMKLESIPCNKRQFLQILSQLHVSGIFQHPLAAGRVILKLCNSGSPSSIHEAVFIFSHLNNPDALISNIILRAYARLSDPEGGLRFYTDHMHRRSVQPNHFTFPLLAKLCADQGAVPDGIKIHGFALKLGFDSDLFVRNSLIYMYSSFGNINSAKRIFNSGVESNIVTWNSIIDGYVKNGNMIQARELFDEMPMKDILTWNVMIAGYVGIGDLEQCRKLFDEMPNRDIISWNSMLLGYAKVGAVKDSRELFDSMPKRNLISWNTILAAYVRAKDYKQCLNLFDQMMATGFQPSEATLVSVLTSCSHLGDLHRGKLVHSYIKNAGNCVNLDLLLSTSLLTMYTKCGDMDSAKIMFESMVEKGVVAWNSMIVGYGMHGRGEDAVSLFMEMEKEGPRPNETTFVCLLSACVHGCLLLEGWWGFNRMVQKYNIKPRVEHYGCMVDLLARAGLLEGSQKLLEMIPSKPGVAALGALLSACAAHSDLKLGKAVASKVIEMDPNDVGSYVLLSNIYAAEGRWDDVEKMREVISSRGLLKGAGISSLSNLKSEVPCLGEKGIPVHKKGIVFSMLSQLGAQMKMSS
ncbi:pentatricopeptide repeat-containing protein At2g20540-like [Wolffia australiana]